MILFSRRYKRSSVVAPPFVAPSKTVLFNERVVNLSTCTPTRFSINEEILHELEIIRSCVEPLFKNMVDQQLEDTQK